MRAGFAAGTQSLLGLACPALHLSHSRKRARTVFQIKANREGLSWKSYLQGGVSSEMQKAASVASMLVLIFSIRWANFWLSTRKIQVYHNFLSVHSFGNFGQCKHIISTASVAGTDVVCIIGTAVLICGQCKHKISTALSLLNLITLFCRDFE